MYLISGLADSVVNFFLNRAPVRQSLYKMALDKELRTKKWGSIVLRNLNQLIADKPAIHKEVIGFFGEQNFQK